jgi:uroporphyrinogen decarboxylase
MPDRVQIDISETPSSGISYVYTMAPALLKKEFGNDCTFLGGGINTAGTLKVGTSNKIREQVIERWKSF